MCVFDWWRKSNSDDHRSFLQKRAPSNRLTSLFLANHLCVIIILNHRQRQQKYFLFVRLSDGIVFSDYDRTNKQPATIGKSTTQIIWELGAGTLKLANCKGKCRCTWLSGSGGLVRCKAWIWPPDWSRLLVLVLCVCVWADLIKAIGSGATRLIAIRLNLYWSSRALVLVIKATECAATCSPLDPINLPARHLTCKFA